MRKPRQNTNKLIDWIDQGLITKEMVADAALSYMSEDDVTGLIDANDWFETDEDEDE